MSPEAQQAVAESFLLLAALHHLAVAVIAVLFWIRRRSMERSVGVYFALAFATSTIALASYAPARAMAALPAGLAALWCLCLLYTSPSPRDVEESRMPSSA